MHFDEIKAILYQCTKLEPNISNLEKSCLFLKNPRWRPPPSCFWKKIYDDFATLSILQSVILRQRPNVTRISQSTSQEWASDEIQNGSSSHLEFWSYDIFGHMIHFTVPLYTYTQNLSQIPHSRTK